jgi:hypothetical protein
MATTAIDAHVASPVFNDSVTGSFTKSRLRNSSISVKK